MIPQSLNIESLHNLMIIIENVCKMIHREIIMKFADGLYQAMEKYSSQLCEATIRSFKKEANDQIMKALEAVMKRCYSPAKRVEMMVELIISINTALLKSDIMERRIQSLKCINELVLERMIYDKVYSIPEVKAKVYKWVVDKNIIEEVFGKRGHVQLMQRSNQVLKICFKATDSLPLDVIWDQIMDPHTKIEIYSSLKSGINVFSAQMIELIIFKTLQYSKQLLLDDLEFIVDLFNFKYEAMPKANCIIDTLIDQICSSKYAFYAATTPIPLKKYSANYAK
jgi:hypothetical protein